MTFVILYYLAYVRMATSCGVLNLELYCDQTPRTCENFILLCNRGYYNGTLFHRSIRHFMVSCHTKTFIRILVRVLLSIPRSKINRSYLFRFKEEILQELGQVERVLGANLLRMSVVRL